MYSKSIPLAYVPLSCIMYHASSSGGANASDSGVKTERVQELKEKMQVELQALWTEQCDQMKKKKEQFATEVSRRHVFYCKLRLIIPFLIFERDLILFFVFNII